MSTAPRSARGSDSVFTNSRTSWGQTKDSQRRGDAGRDRQRRTTKNIAVRGSENKARVPTGRVVGDEGGYYRGRATKLDREEHNVAAASSGRDITDCSTQN
jgi:hypothetical protein